MDKNERKQAFESRKSLLLNNRAGFKDGEMVDTTKVDDAMELPDRRQIHWERGEMMERDREERYAAYLMKGTDKAGREYSGTGHYSCGELSHITDIDFV